MNALYFCFIILIFCQLVKSIENFSISEIPICNPISRLQGKKEIVNDEKKITVIGDIHGDYDGFLEILFHSNITISNKSCEWKKNDIGILLIQTGDIVDRGAKTVDVINCLEYLQSNAINYNSKVIRLIGNHELWWLTGLFHMRNKATDTPENINSVVHQTIQGIRNGNILGSYSHFSHGVPILFSHAGLRPDMLNLIKKHIDDTYNISNNNNNNIDQLSSYINNILNYSCSEINLESSSSSKCVFTDPIFEAGKERGGNGIGGSYWTDFQILSQAAKNSIIPLDFIQIVGHTMLKGKIKTSINMEVICVDAAMYLGGRAYLTIDNGRFYSYEKFNNKWIITDLTSVQCEA
jgi:hypothetical protein